MTSDERLDLSLLDPGRYPARWQAIVTATVARTMGVVDERSKREGDVFYLIAAWRTSLLTAAAAMIIALVPAEIALELRESRAEAIHRLAVLSASSAQGKRPPTASEILRAMANEELQ